MQHCSKTACRSCERSRPTVQHGTNPGVQASETKTTSSSGRWYLVNERLATDACSRVSSLRLQVDEATPHVLGGVGVVADLSVRVKTKHLRRVAQRQRLNVLLPTTATTTSITYQHLLRRRDSVLPQFFGLSASNIIQRQRTMDGWYWQV